MNPVNKDTIYIDIDEEITGIIDKVRGSDGKIVALVLPKRASVLQSIVNMKLLKRSADEAKKRLVLITSETSLLPLAGAVGLHVAKTPQSKPMIPLAPTLDDGAEETIDEAAPAAYSAASLADRPVGELAAMKPAVEDDMETLELDEEDEAALAAGAPILPPAAAAGAAALKKKDKKNHKLAVPNFERFRLLLVLGGFGVVALIVGVYYALAVLPKAEIAVTTNASNVNVGLDLVLSTTATKTDAEEGIVPAKLATQSKNYTQQASATGQKNNGERASGEITIINCSEEDELTIPAGTGVSSASMTFITQRSITFELSGKTNNGCKTVDGFTSGSVKVLAQTAGATYNLAAGTSFTVAGFNGLTSTSKDAFSGGTDNIVKVVSQADIDSAKQKIVASDATVKQELRKQLQQDGLLPVTASYVAGTPALTASVEAGAVADAVIVTAAVKHTMFGVKQSDLKTLVDADIKSQIDTTKQSILNEGIEEASFEVTNPTDTSVDILFESVATAGPDIDAAELKELVAGKKGGDIKQLLQSNPGVTDVQVRLSPFWVSSVPTKPEKITITIAQPTPAADDSDN